METKSRGREEIFMERKMVESEASSPPDSENSKIRMEAKQIKAVPVIYYLSRNGQLEHPHLMEVPISSPQGILCLKDVIDRLSFLRGQGMANMYSWSAKRSYKKGYVWQDLCENDFIDPSSGHEYVLKGTRLIEATCSSFGSYETISSSSTSDTNNCSNSDVGDSPAGRGRSMEGRRRRSCDDEKVYKAKTWRELSLNASTQTEEEKKEEEEECEKVRFSSSSATSASASASFGALEGCLLEGYGSAADIRNQRVENEERASGRMKPSQVLMQFILRCRSS